MSTEQGCSAYAEAKIGGPGLASHVPAIISNVAVAVVRPLLHHPLRLVAMVNSQILVDDVPATAEPQGGASGEAVITHGVDELVGVPPGRARDPGRQLQLAVARTGSLKRLNRPPPCSPAAVPELVHAPSSILFVNELLVAYH
jgi:hypothetical protein